MAIVERLGGAARSVVTTRGPLRLVLVLVVLLVISIGLAILNAWLGLDQYVAAPYPIIRHLWLPLLFLLVCLNAWLIRTLWTMWTADRSPADLAEIDRAWNEARLAMRRAAVELRELPVFLVLGDSVGGGPALFHTSGMPLAVSDVPRRPDAPIHVFATYEAIFVTCPGISALGHLARSRTSQPDGHLAGSSDPPMRPALHDGSAETGDSNRGAPETGPTSTSAESTSATAVAATTAVAPEPARAPAGGQPAQRERSLEILLSQTEEVETLTRKLKHLCKLILRDRQPYCPINGILLLLPYAATNSESEARQAGTAGHLDLTVIRDSILVDCPVYAMMCDLETAPHCDRLLQEFSEEQRSQPMGRTFPLVPDLQVSERIRMVEAGADWIGHASFMPLFYRLLRFSTREDGLQENIRDNARLFRFFAEMHGRSRRLGRLLGRLISLDQRGQIMLGGCFLASTGRDPKSEQGFVGGVLQLLIDGQNFVAWTPEAIRREARYRRLTTLGNLGAAVLALLGAAVLFAFFRP